MKKSVANLHVNIVCECARAFVLPLAVVLLWFVARERKKQFSKCMRDSMRVRVHAAAICGGVILVR